MSYHIRSNRGVDVRTPYADQASGLTGGIVPERDLLTARVGDLFQVSSRRRGVITVEVVAD